MRPEPLPAILCCAEPCAPTSGLSGKLRPGDSSLWWVQGTGEVGGGWRDPGLLRPLLSFHSSWAGGLWSNYLVFTLPAQGFLMMGLLLILTNASCTSGILVVSPPFKPVNTSHWARYGEGGGEDVAHSFGGLTVLRSSAQLSRPFVQGAALQQPETHMAGVQGRQFPIHRAGEHSVSWVNSATLPRASRGWGWSCR